MLRLIMPSCTILLCKKSVCKLHEQRVPSSMFGHREKPKFNTTFSNSAECNWQCTYLLPLVLWSLHRNSGLTLLTDVGPPYWNPLLKSLKYSIVFVHLFAVQLLLVSNTSLDLLDLSHRTCLTVSSSNWTAKIKKNGWIFIFFQNIHEIVRKNCLSSERQKSWIAVFAHRRNETSLAS